MAGLSRYGETDDMMPVRSSPYMPSHLLDAAEVGYGLRGQPVAAHIRLAVLMQAKPTLPTIFALRVVA